MDSQTLGVVMSGVKAIESEIATLHSTFDAEPLVVSDRQYLARCLELMVLELDALREYVRGLPS